MESMYFDDVEVGQFWVSQARTVTQGDVSQFATMTGDFNPLHVDHDFAASGPYRQPIAHGLLGLSWVAGAGKHRSFDADSCIYLREVLDLSSAYLFR